MVRPRIYDDLTLMRIAKLYERYQSVRAVSRFTQIPVSSAHMLIQRAKEELQGVS